MCFQQLEIYYYLLSHNLASIASSPYHLAFSKCTTGTHYIGQQVSATVHHPLTCHQGPSSAVHCPPAYYPPSSLHHPTFSKCWHTLHQHTGQRCCSLSACFTVHHHPPPIPLTILHHPPSTCLPTVHHCPPTRHPPSPLPLSSSWSIVALHLHSCCLKVVAPCLAALSHLYQSSSMYGHWGDNISFYRIFLFILAWSVSVSFLLFNLFIHNKYNREPENRQLVRIKLFLKNKNNRCVHRGRQ